MFKLLTTIFLCFLASRTRADFVAHNFFKPAGPAPARVTAVGFPDGLALPAPIIFENFERVAEFQLSGVGWTEQNYTDIVVAGSNPNSAVSDTYLGWTLLGRSRLETVFGALRLKVAPGQVVNGAPVVELLSGNLLYAESDQRNGNQVQFLYSPIYDCAGRRDLVLVFNSAYEQNQDSIAGVEYTVDRGLTWRPILYMIDQDDIIRAPDGTVDAVATLAVRYSDVAVYQDPVSGSFVGGNYGAFLAAPISQELAPYISGRLNDDSVESKRVEAFRIPGADEQPNVQFRLFQAGTASWYWGIDDWGIYSIPQVQETYGPLVDQLTGANTGVTCTLSVAGRPLSPFISDAAAPRAPAPGADASLVFGADLARAGATLIPSGSAQRLLLNGLDPRKAYELILFSDLGARDGSAGVVLSYTLQDADSFENASSSHPTLATVSGARNETTTLDITDNGAPERGLVCRYRRIRAGADGAVQVSLQSARPAGLNALKLVETTLEAVRQVEPPTLTENSATLHGEAASETSADIYVYWGPKNGGDQSNAWEHVEWAGAFTSGTFTFTLTNLETFREYFYAFLSQSPNGASWSPAVPFRPRTEGMVYQTGFEPEGPEPFQPGVLQGQGRPGLWRVGQGQASVQKETVSRGMQAVQAGECVIEAALTNHSEVVWVDAFFRDAGATNQPIVPSDQASSVLVFSANLGILALDGDGQGGGAFVSVMPGYPKDRFVRVTLRTDYNAKRYDVWIDGAPRRMGLRFKDDAVQQLSGARRQSQSSNYMDDFSVSLWGLDADSDGDGLVDLDEAKFYGSYPLLADSDGDGAPDGQEVMAHTDPADSNSLFAIGIGLDAQGNKLIRVPTISGLEYSLQRKETLGNGAWEEVPNATPIQGDGQEKVFLETSDGVNYFYRGVIQNR